MKEWLYPTLKSTITLPDAYEYFSPTADCINQYRNIARQYGYFYKMFNSPSFKHSLPFKDVFTFDDYRYVIIVN